MLKEGGELHEFTEADLLLATLNGKVIKNRFTAWANVGHSTHTAFINVRSQDVKGLRTTLAITHIGKIGDVWYGHNLYDDFVVYLGHHEEELKRVMVYL